MELTIKQEEVLSAINILTSKNGVSPTLKEVKEYLGYGEISSVQRHTEALKTKGFLTTSKHQSRSFKIVKRLSKKSRIPLLGSIACGQPILAVENIEAYIPHEVKGDPRDYFFLHAIGDSMNKANIYDGDIVLIKKQEIADNDEKVVALIGDEATIKIFKQEKDRIVLEPRSSNLIHKKIYIYDSEEFQIQGIVVGKIKK